MAQSDDVTMWTIQEFTAAKNIWGVRVAKLMAPPPATINTVTSAGIKNVTIKPRWSASNRGK